MPKIALKLLLTASALHRNNRRMGRLWPITIFSTIVTITLLALYLRQRGTLG